MTHKETEILITKYLNGETTLEEEKQLALEVTRDDAPEEWKLIAAMMGELATDEALFDHIMAERATQRFTRKPSLQNWWWAAAACLLLLVGFGFSWRYHRHEADKTVLAASEPATETAPTASSAPTTTMVAETYQDPARVTQFIKELAKDGNTMILVTHEMRFAYEISDKVIFMDNGKVAKVGTPKEIFEDRDLPRLQEFLSTFQVDLSKKKED